MFLKNKTLFTHKRKSKIIMKIMAIKILIIHNIFINKVLMINNNKIQKINKTLAKIIIIKNIMKTLHYNNKMYKI